MEEWNPAEVPEEDDSNTGDVGERELVLVFRVLCCVICGVTVHV